MHSCRWEAKGLLPTGCPASTQLSIRWAGQPGFLCFPQNLQPASHPQTSDLTSHPPVLCPLSFSLSSLFFLLLGVFQHFPKVPKFRSYHFVLWPHIPALSLYDVPFLLLSTCDIYLRFPQFFALLLIVLIVWKHFPQVIQSIPRPLISPACPLTSLLPTILRNIIPSYHSPSNNPIVKKQDGMSHVIGIILQDMKLHNFCLIY